MRRPLIIIFLLFLLFVIFFYFSLGTRPSYIGNEPINLPVAKNAFESEIQKNPAYVYVEGQGYVLKDRKIVLFVGADTAQARQEEAIKDIEGELESYWKWQILSGERNIEDIVSTKRNSNGDNDGNRKNIFSRVFDVFKVADAINVIKDTNKTCDCDDDFVLLSGKDLHLIKTILNPDGGAAGSGNNNEVGSFDLEKIKHIKQTNNEVQAVGYGRKDALLVGVIDSGVNNDTMLAGRMNTSLNYNFLNHTSDVSDATLHGTEIASIIVSKSESRQIGIVGLKTYDTTSTGNLYDNLCAILYAIKHNIKVVNASWGTYHQEPIPVFEEVLRRAKAANTVIICSAGNDDLDIGKQTYYPACYADNIEFGNNIITVTSRNKSENICQNTSSTKHKIDLSMLADADCKHFVPNSSGGIYLKGTSFAAPYITANVVNYLLKKPSKFSKSNFITTIPLGGDIKKY